MYHPNSDQSNASIAYSPAIVPNTHGLVWAQLRIDVASPVQYKEQ